MSDEHVGVAAGASESADLIEQLSAARRSAGLDAAEVGRRMFGASAAYVTALETGGDAPFSALQRYARAVGGQLVVGVDGSLLAAPPLVPFAEPRDALVRNALLTAVGLPRRWSRGEESGTVGRSDPTWDELRGAARAAGVDLQVTFAAGQQTASAGAVVQLVQANLPDLVDGYGRSEQDIAEGRVHDIDDVPQAALKGGAPGRPAGRGADRSDGGHGSSQGGPSGPLPHQAPGRRPGPARGPAATT